MLAEYEYVLRIRLSQGLPAQVEPMILDRYENVWPIRTAQGRYPPEKRIFLEKTVRKLIYFGFLKPSTEAEWVAAPLVAPKAPPAMYR